MAKPYAHIVVSECASCSYEAATYIASAEHWLDAHGIRHDVIKPGTHMYYWLIDAGSLTPPFVEYNKRFVRDPGELVV